MSSVQSRQPDTRAKLSLAENAWNEYVS